MYRPACLMIACLMTVCLMTVGLGLAACTGLDLDPPTRHREFPKAESSATAPPVDLLNGTAK